jgi:hypothetical protein
MKGISPSSKPLRHPQRRDPVILYTCCTDIHRKNQAQRIDYQTSLAPLHFFARVEATVPALRGTASLLGIQDSR